MGRPSRLVKRVLSNPHLLCKLLWVSYIFCLKKFQNKKSSRTSQRMRIVVLNPKIILNIELRQKGSNFFSSSQSAMCYRYTMPQYSRNYFSTLYPLYSNIFLQKSNNSSFVKSLLTLFVIGETIARLSNLLVPPLDTGIIWSKA